MTSIGLRPRTDRLVYPASLDASGIQAAIDIAEAASGGTVVLPAGTITINTMLTIDSSRVRLVGQGAVSGMYDTADASGGTVLVAGGAIAAIIKCTSVNAAATAISNVAVTDMTLDANELADRCLYVVSARDSEFARLHLRNALVACLDTAVVGSLTDGVEDVQGCVFDQITARAVEGSAASAICFRFDGTIDVGNFSLNRLGDLFARHANGAGYHIANADSNNFVGPIVASRTGGGTGIGIDLKGSATLNKGHARANTFGFVDAGAGGLTSRGTGLTQPAVNNTITVYSLENSAPMPTVEPGSSLYYTTHTGRIEGMLRPDFRTWAPVIKDDFSGGNASTATAGELGWTVTNGTLTQLTAEANHPGIARHSVTTSAQVAHIRMGSGNDTTLLPADYFDMQWVIRLNDASANVSFRAGLGSASGTAPPAAGIYIEKALADTSWFGVCRSASTETRTAALAAVGSGSWIRFRMRRVSSTAIAFSVNDGTEVTVATNVPTAALALFGHIVNNDGIAKTVDYDYVELVQALSR